MCIVYRVKIPFTGEIKESSNLKRLYQITIDDLRDYVGVSGFDGFKAYCLSIERVVYDCSEDCDDYWNHPELDRNTLFLIYMSKISMSIMRVSDNKECYTSRV